MVVCSRRQCGLATVALVASTAAALRAPTRTPPLGETTRRPHPSPCCREAAGRCWAGFNTWVQFGMKTNATILTETAEAFVRLGLKDLGYTYVNSDDGWNGGREQGCPDGQPTCPGGKDLPHGAMRPSGGFPQGMRAVADHIHGLGLKLGLCAAPSPLPLTDATASTRSQPI